MHVKTEDISQYMKEISSIPTITREEETRLANEMKNGDQATSDAARDKLICSNLRLVVKLAHEFKGKGVSFADLVEEGNTGLITAVEKFDPAKGVKFSCYAAWWIKEAMHRALYHQSRVVRVPSGTTQRMMKLVKARRAYNQEFGVDPSVEELASMTGFSVDSILSLLKYDVSVVSIDEKVSDESDTTFASVLADEIDESDSRNKLKAEVTRAVEKLSDMDRLIVAGLFGFGEEIEDIKGLAQETGMPVEALQERLTGILASLRATLGPTLPTLSPSF